MFKDKPVAPELSAEGRGLGAGQRTVLSGLLQSRSFVLYSCLSALPCLTARPPPPILYFMENYPVVKHQITQETLGCRAPVRAAEIQLRLGEKVLDTPRVCLIRNFCLFYLNLKKLDGQGPFTCRYLVHRKLELWSEDSKPIELLWTDGEASNRAAGRGGLERQRRWSEMSRIGIPKQNFQIRIYTAFSASVSQPLKRIINTATLSPAKNWVIKEVWHRHLWTSTCQWILAGMMWACCLPRAWQDSELREWDSIKGSAVRLESCLSG